MIAALLLGRGEPHEEGEISLPQLFSPGICPALVAVLGQKLPGVELDRRPVGYRIVGATGRGSSLLKDLYIHPYLPARAQRELLALEGKVAGGRARVGIEDPASYV